MTNGAFLKPLLARLDRLADRLDAIFGPAATVELDPDALAWRWRTSAKVGGYLEAVASPHRIRLEDLVGIERQAEVLDSNTRQFINRLPCNNALLWGARGTGKSSLVKAMLHRYATDGLRLVEVDAHDLIDLPEVVAPLTGRDERYNDQSRLVNGELHHGEAVEEKISLSERFGVWLSFHPFSQDLYLQAVTQWLRNYGEVEPGVSECR